MAETDLKAQIRSLIDAVEDDSVLEIVKLILVNSSESKDWWNSLSESSKERTLESLAEYKRGEYKSHANLMQEMAEKYPQLKFK